MNWAASLRWILLPTAVVFGGLCLLSAATPARAGAAVVSGLLWFWLSRRKVMSLDRGSLGIPPRR